jgi:hypothetical protein
MTIRPSLPEPGTGPRLIKAKPCRAALKWAGLDNAAARRPGIRAWPGRGKAIFSRTEKYRGGFIMPA